MHVCVSIRDSTLRRNALKIELVRAVEELKKAGVKRIILFGSLAKDEIGPASDIDLLVVQETKKRFIERLGELYELINPKYALDLLVYTPSEFNEMKKKSTFIKQILREGKLLYEA
ncbi:MAG TPA: nucleotidyltransferase domain-containing protein [Candidatus Methanoperedens sp.]